MRGFRTEACCKERLGTLRRGSPYSGGMNTILYGLRQKLLVPVRRWLWRCHAAPFLHRPSPNRTFRLCPDEYVDGEIYVHGAYEYRLLALISRHVRGGTFIDVGANIGNHALYLAANFDRVICFEPNPPIVARLRENIALSGACNIVVHAVGLGEENTALPFHHNDAGNAGGGTFLDASFPVSGTLSIRVGDEVLGDCGPVALVKIDVEGFETFVFRGLRQTIAKYRPLVIFEHDGRRPRLGDWRQIAECLPEYSFAELSGIPGTGLGKIAAALSEGAETRLLEFQTPESRFYETILAFPSDRMAEKFGVKTIASS